VSLNLSLHAKRALVTGGSQGLGLASALELADLGAEVLLVARDKAKLDKALSTLSAAHGVHHSAYVLDLSDRQAVAQFASTIAAGSPISILVNNSGGPPPGPAVAAKPDDYISAIEGHLAAYQLLVQAVVPGMRAAGYGRIINILSTSVIQPLRGLGVSNSLRAAVANWGRTLAAELGGDGITVNNVLPGMTRTERLDRLFQFRAQAVGQKVEEAEGLALQYIPAGRFGKPEEVAAAVAFLASPAAAYINGVSLAVDGGRLACQ